MNISVNKITIEFSKGSFAEWCNMTEENSEEEISNWQDNFYSELEKNIKETYPNANIILEESYNQMAHDKIMVDVEETDKKSDYNAEEDHFSLGDDGYVLWQAEEDTKNTVVSILDKVYNDGLFW